MTIEQGTLYGKLVDTACSARITHSLAQRPITGATEPASAHPCGVHYHECPQCHFDDRLKPIMTCVWRPAAKIDEGVCRMRRNADGLGRSYISPVCALRGSAEPWQGLVKILPHMSDKLAIRGMIGRLNTDDNWIQRRHVLLYVP